MVQMVYFLNSLIIKYATAIVSSNCTNETTENTTP